jgi:cytochrome o ubiquinol oxidase subunit 2
MSSHFSGDGFSGMHFTTRAVSPAEFANWVETTRQSGPALDDQTYGKLEAPSLAVTPFTYREAAPGLYERIVSLALSPAPGPSLAVANPVTPKPLSR